MRAAASGRLFECEYNCGFHGSYTDVAEHERVCTLRENSSHSARASQPMTSVQPTSSSASAADASADNGERTSTSSASAADASADNGERTSTSSAVVSLPRQVGATIR